MPVFPESDLYFAFPEDWIVRKFDESVAYQSLSGHGLKGVDFIALSPDGRLWLMEVKNYRPRTKENKEYRATRQSPGQLAAHVLRKFHDTHRLLRIVDASLRRRWWTRLKLFYRERIRPSPRSNYWFWTEAKRRADTPARLVYLLWLETPERAKDYDASTRAALAAALPPEAVLYVVEGGSSPTLPVRSVTGYGSANAIEAN